MHLPRLMLRMAVAAAVAAGPAAAEEALTLERAIAIAEAQNHQLRAADARLGAAAAGVDEARSYRLPRLDLEAGYQRSDNPVLVFGNLLRQEDFGAENFDLGRLNRPDALDNWNVTVMVEQPLWTGGRLARGEEAARLGRDAASSGRERARQEVVRRTIASYTGAVVADRRLEVAREALATAGAHVGLIRDLYEGGLVVESDLLLARVRESELREEVIRAESGVEVARATLNLVLGRDLATPIVLPETLELEPADGEDLEALIERARGGRPDLEAARRQTAAAQTGVALARAGRRPTVGFQAAWETNARDFFGNDGDNVTLGVGLRLPLFDGFATRARERRAREQASEAEVGVELLTESVALEVRQAFSELRAAGQRLEQSAQSVGLARRSLTIVEDRYKEGLTTLPELLDAETALTTARLREVAARRDVLLARASLDLATGEL